jgi:hypothetical protein
MPTLIEEKRIAMEKHLNAARVHMRTAAEHQWDLALFAAGTGDYATESQLSVKIRTLSLETNIVFTALNME